MHLVDDIDLLFCPGGGINGIVPQLADVVNAGVGGRIDLHHIQQRSVGDGAAGGTDAAGLAILQIFAVDRLGKNAGAGGFSRAAGATEEICMADATRDELIFQRPRDTFLADDIFKARRAPFSVQRQVLHIVAPSLPAVFLDMEKCA